MTDPLVVAPTSPSPILAELKALGVPRFSADGSALIRPDGSVFGQIALNPIVSPAPGTYGPTQVVALTTGTAGASIYYTTNGDVPTTASTLYSGPITVAADTTIKAIAVVAGQITSPVTTAAYVITNGTAATPTFTPAAGAVANPTDVTLASTTPGAVIHYTVNGSTPTTASPVYADPVTVTTAVTIKALAVADGYANSAVGTAAYTITP